METVSLRGQDLRFCTGCLACQKTQRCVQADDAPDLVRRMHDADAIAFATPIYYYEMSGQMKTLLDRANPCTGPITASAASTCSPPRPTTTRTPPTAPPPGWAAG